MKLKTLKDFGIYYLRNDANAEYLKNLLKQEAIKYIKELEKEYFKELKNPNGRNKAFYHEQQLRMTYLNAQIIWIKHFFNITEEDLK